VCEGNERKVRAGVWHRWHEWVCVAVWCGMCGCVLPSERVATPAPPSASAARRHTNAHSRPMLMSVCPCPPVCAQRRCCAVNVAATGAARARGWCGSGRQGARWGSGVICTVRMQAARGRAGRGQGGVRQVEGCVCVVRARRRKKKKKSVQVGIERQGVPSGGRHALPCHSVQAAARGRR